VTSFQIVVRAVDEQRDMHAHQLIREILQLSKKHLPSLATIFASSSKLTLHTAQLYRITGNLTTPQVEQLTRELLLDPVVQDAALMASEVAQPIVTQASTGHISHVGHIIDVFFHAGVTDTLAESVQTGAHMLGIPGLAHVETGRRYILDARLSVDDAHTIAQALLYNPVIQEYIFYPAGRNEEPFSPPSDSSPSVGAAIHCARGEPPTHANHGIPTECRDSSPSVGAAIHCARGSQINAITRTIPILSMTDEQLLEVSQQGLLALDLGEMRTIQQHYKSQGREPTDVELETLAQTWSEHCSHKTFKATIDYREVDEKGQVVARETIDDLLKRYIMRATEQIRPSWLVSAFSDNAGIIRLTDSHDIAFKVETHNHPSAIEPFGGANTGVGGVIRDVLGVSAQPIACSDVLCFGPQEISADELPSGVFPPRRIASGVVNGIRDYGNKIGIPTVNGAILYHPGYIFNPLVFCGCLGILPHGSHPSSVEPGDLIVCLGGRTGRDGVHGATFSSGAMSLEINQQAGAAVQIGAPITEKKVTDVIIQARDRHLYHAITDCGAGGFSSAIGEMGAKTGACVELEQAPLKYQGLAPWEIWLSEAQERMILAVPPTALEELLAICAIEEVEASVLGSFTSDHRLTLTYHGQIVADMDMDFLHHGLPRKHLEAVWTRVETGSTHTCGDTDAVKRVSTCSPDQSEDRDRCSNSLPEKVGTPVDYQYFVSVGPTPIASASSMLIASVNATLLALLCHTNIASKEDVVRRYDHEVQGATVLKPLVGRSGNGPSDAAVLQPLIGDNQGNGQSKVGVVVSNGMNPLYGRIDPYHMAMNAVDEALRNLTAVGGDVDHAAILDNFCWGNPNDPEQLGTLVRAAKGCHDAALAFQTPFISGKDSLNNEYRTDGRCLPVLPTLLISAVSVIEDASRAIDMSLKTPGNLLYLIGATRHELAGSHYAEVIGPDTFDHLFPHTQVPKVDTTHARITMQALGQAIRQGLVCACHDLSEGGLAVAAAEMSLAGQLGATLNLAHIKVKEAPTMHPNAVSIVQLFSETPSRFLVEVTPEQCGTFGKHLLASGVVDIIHVGAVNNNSHFIVHNSSGPEIINLDVEELQAAWK
jgi:phosphoribosylformylglycinamidine synthase subunit PurSL